MKVRGEALKTGVKPSSESHMSRCCSTSLQLLEYKSGESGLSVDGVFKDKQGRGMGEEGVKSIYN